MTLRTRLLFAAMTCAACSSSSARDARTPAPMRVVELLHARLPEPLTPLAAHYWFTVYDATTRRWERWEVWQEASQCATSWGHVHRDLQGPWSNVGGGEAVLDEHWTGAEAERLIATLHRPEEYPDRDAYRAWPGPNSNTYVAWVLREANVSADLSPLGIGKDWRGWIGAGTTTTGTGLHFSTPIVGAKLGVLDGVELQVFALTFGFSAFPPTLKTPFGALSLPR